MGLVLDLSGEACPAPLVKSRRAMDKMGNGENLEIIVTDTDSKGNITMAAEKLRMEVRRVEEDKDGRWHIIIGKK